MQRWHLPICLRLTACHFAGINLLYLLLIILLLVCVVGGVCGAHTLQASFGACDGLVVFSIPHPTPRCFIPKCLFICVWSMVPCYHTFCLAHPVPSPGCAALALHRICYSFSTAVLEVRVLVLSARTRGLCKVLILPVFVPGKLAEGKILTLTLPGMAIWPAFC